MTVDHFITMEIQNYHQPYVSTAHTSFHQYFYKPHTHTAEFTQYKAILIQYNNSNMHKH